MALPNRPGRTFSHVSDVFAWSGSPKRTFGALGLSRAVPVAMRVSAADERRNGNWDPGTGSPTDGPGSRSQPRPPLKGAVANSYPVCGSASIPPPLQHVCVLVIGSESVRAGIGRLWAQELPPKPYYRHHHSRGGQPMFTILDDY